MKKKDQYFKVQASTDGDTANIFLYDYIGAEYWLEEDDTKDLTDIAFVQKMRELEANHSLINIRISSNGGSVKHGLPMMTAIGNSTAEVHTYADGVVASMAADIFMAAPHRHMAKNALVMVHGASGGCWGNAEAMRREADILEKMNEAASVSIVEATGMTQEEVNERFYDGNDHWLTYKDATDMGIVNEAEEYETEADGDTEKMKRQTYDFFKSQKEKFQAHYKSLMSDKKVQDAPKEEVLEIEKQEKPFEMQTNADIVKAANDGTLDKADLIERLTAEKSVSEKYNELLTIVKSNQSQLEAVSTQLAAEQEKNAKLTEQLGETPAAGATKVATDGDVQEPVSKLTAEEQALENQFQ